MRDSKGLATKLFPQGLYNIAGFTSVTQIEHYVISCFEGNLYKANIYLYLFLFDEQLNCKLRCAGSLSRYRCGMNFW